MYITVTLGNGVQEGFKAGTVGKHFRAAWRHETCSSVAAFGIMEDLIMGTAWR